MATISVPRPPILKLLPLPKLPLHLRRLRRHAKQVRHARTRQPRRLVAVRARLRGTPPRARDGVPLGRDDLARGGGAGVHKDENKPGEGGDVDLGGRVAGGWERDAGESEAGEVVASAVVDGRGEVGWEGGCKCFGNLVMSDCMLQNSDHLRYIWG
ncbi:hypothetical protein CGMCC3_g10468 [Colletotrichum fructicola]|nr:uncharacterized protein CGMCC3_g10468 [Colletotrichum fructicola]KAE9573542.1 hypothetical protein CGMCC3_g10468 [Colletotrichum fructicola]